MANVLRLIWGTLFFALSLLAVFPAPTNILWRLAVLATEFGHFLALLALLVFLPGWRSGKIAVVLGFLAAVLFLTPLLRAWPVATRLPEQMVRAFGVNSSERTVMRDNPMDLLDLIFGVSYPKVEYATYKYADKNGESLTLDLYRPFDRDSLSPAVVVIHAGAWQTGDSQQLPALNSYLASRGYVVAAINYRLAPRWRYPAAVEDVLSAIDFLRTHASEFGLDARRIVLLGRSSGGHLALHAAYTVDDPAIRGVVSFYAPADLYYGYTHPANPWVIDSEQILEDFLGGNPDELPDVYEKSSPYQFVNPATPPTLLIHGARDELVFPQQSRRLADKLADNGVPHFYLQLPWATHGCDFNFSGPSGQLSTYAIEHFLSVVF